MLKKLLKYDFVDVYRHWWIAAVSILALSILGGFGISALNFEKNYPDALLLILSLGMVFAILGYVVFYIFSFILSYKRFYQNFFTDEGYLTFTLPVTCSQHIISKLILCSVTFTATTLVVLLNIFIMLFIGLGPMFPWAEIRTFVSDFLTNIQYQLGDFWIVYALEFLLFCILSTVLSCLFVFCCITIASIIAKKAKILTAVIIYYVLNGVFSFAVQIINLFGISTLSNWVYNFSPMLKNVTISLAAFGVLLVLTLLCVLLYTFEHWLLDRKLNLA